ncbi:MAG: hypothetical protein HYU63_00925 [Armatimonadetes bacterium]|nr:hypothetical protein [Armatimonadota bacterium]
MKERIKNLFIIFLLILFVIFLEQKISKENFKMIPKNSDASTTITGIFLDALGELRYTMAAYLWIKVDIYFHEMESEGHSWTKNKTIMPLIKLVVALDPHFYQAYDFGGYHLAVNLNKVNEGINFIQEGLRNNPDNLDLLMSLSFVYFHVKKYDQAINYAKRALPLTKNNMERLNSMRILVHSYLNSKDTVKAIFYLNKIIPLDPEPDWAKNKLKELIKK